MPTSEWSDEGLAPTPSVPWTHLRDTPVILQGQFFMHNAHSTRNQATNTDLGDSGRSSHSSGYYGSAPMATHLKTSSGNTWGNKGEGQSKAWKDSANYEVVDTPLNDWPSVASESCSALGDTPCLTLSPLLSVTVSKCLILVRSLVLVVALS